MTQNVTETQKMQEISFDFAAEGNEESTELVSIDS
jgi:hypothetical protein